MLPQLYVLKALCSHSSMLQQLYAATALCSHSFMLPQLYVPTALGCHSSRLPQLFVPTALCCHSSLFSQLYVSMAPCSYSSMFPTPQWGAADAEIKFSPDENTELQSYPFKAWSRSVYCHACYTYSQGFLSCKFLPFRSIHLHFFQNLSRFFPVLAVANTGSCVGLQNKIGHSAGCRFPCWMPAEYE